MRRRNRYYKDNRRRQLRFLQQEGQYTRDHSDNGGADRNDGIDCITNHNTADKICYRADKPTGKWTKCYSGKNYRHIFKAESHNISAAYGKIFSTYYAYRS